MFQNPSFPPRSILIVDHDEDAANSLAALLAELGHDVEIVHNGPSAVERERAFRPDIAVIELTLPGRGAYALAQELGAREHRHIELVCLGDLGQVAAARSAKKDAGFSHHLIKPVDLAAIHLMLYRLSGPEVTATHEALKSVSLFQRGILVEQEFVLRMFENGARYDPAQMIGVIPEELVDAIRASASLLPGDVSQSPYSFIDPSLPPEQIKALRDKVQEGAWRWFRYFNVPGE